MCSNHSGHKLPGTLDVVILPDNRIRVDTGSFAGATHTSAAMFLQALAKELGVTVESSTPLGHGHTHEHEADHISAGSGGPSQGKP